MTTSGTSSFSLDVVELIEEAFERAGSEARSGNDFRTARRSLNLMQQEWSNRGLNLWTIESGTIELEAGVSTYALPADTIDLIEHVVRLDGTDMPLRRISVSTYAQTANKAQAQRPTVIFVARTTAPTITLWPVPERSYTLVYWRLRRLQDASSATVSLDIPSRFLPAMVAGLAYYIAMKKPELGDRIPMLKGVYDEEFQRAADEDRDRASVFLRPGR